ncbi:DNA-directed RNA polymerase I subunit RPA49 isoform X2 [Cinclus cinclus]|uniref:DNA-directed RNA polymerase I subunit RPA49 isoform X2 n=1 Tax=Cinclus cinclus TaxID=127875 RepID=UPI002E151726
MAAATWRYRGDPEGERPAALVRFAHGKLQRPDSLRFTVYRNRDTAHPRKKHRRILVSETERLCYVGHNFGSEVMKCNTLCRYFVGVLDKNSGQMEVYNAEIFNMQPLLSDNPLPDDTKDYQNKSYREKMDLCIEAFGTSKQKRALSSRRMNAVSSDIVSTAVTKAAANVIDAKGVTALVQDVAQDDVQNISAFLPPCYEDADRPEHIYKFEDSIFSVSRWLLTPVRLDDAIWHVGESQAFAPHRPRRAGSKSCLLLSMRHCGCQQLPWPASLQRRWPREQRREGNAAARGHVLAEGQQGCLGATWGCHSSGAEEEHGIQVRQGSSLGEWNVGDRCVTSARGPLGS